MNNIIRAITLAVSFTLLAAPVVAYADAPVPTAPAPTAKRTTSCDGKRQLKNPTTRVCKGRKGKSKAPTAATGAHYDANGLTAAGRAYGARQIAMFGGY